MRLLLWKKISKIKNTFYSFLVLHVSRKLKSQAYGLSKKSMLGLLLIKEQQND